MLTLDAEPTLFGSGERYTDPKTFNTSGREFDSLAYAKYEKRTIDLVYTEIYP